MWVAPTHTVVWLISRAGVRADSCFYDHSEELGPSNPTERLTQQAVHQANPEPCLTKLPTNDLLYTKD